MKKQRNSKKADPLAILIWPQKAIFELKSAIVGQIQYNL
jgi:hypothetical protein